MTKIYQKIAKVFLAGTIISTCLIGCANNEPILSKEEIEHNLAQQEIDFSGIPSLEHDHKIHTHPTTDLLPTVVTPPDHLFKKMEDNQMLNELKEKVRKRTDQTYVICHFKVDGQYTTEDEKNLIIQNDQNVKIDGTGTFNNRQAYLQMDYQSDNKTDPEMSFKDNGREIILSSDYEYVHSDKENENIWYTFKTPFLPVFEAIYLMPLEMQFSDRATIKFDEGTKTYVIEEDLPYWTSRYRVLNTFILSSSPVMPPYMEQTKQYEETCESAKEMYQNQKVILTYKEDGTPLNIRIELGEIAGLIQEWSLNIDYIDWTKNVNKKMFDAPENQINMESEADHEH